MLIIVQLPCTEECHCVGGRPLIQLACLGNSPAPIRSRGGEFHRVGSPVAEGEGEDSVLPCIQESRACNDVLDVAATGNGTGDRERDGVLCGHDIISCGIAQHKDCQINQVLRNRTTSVYVYCVWKYGMRSGNME